MNSLIYIFIAACWLMIAIVDYGFFCYVWQLEEYRHDRFKNFLSTVQGKNFLKSYLILGRLLVLLIIMMSMFVNLRSVFPLMIAIFVFEVARVARKFFKKQTKFPKMTTKAALIVALAVFFEFFVAYFLLGAVGVLLVFFFRFFVLTAVVFLAYLPTRTIKLTYVFFAKRKLKKCLNLKIVGITGSYGKTTVKNFLDQILSAKFKVVSTPKNINTEIGVAKFVLNHDFSRDEIFIVEMGAYNMGEIKLICDMVAPEIGILTAINEQHLSLFGSVENIQKAKFELLFSLPKNGLALTNADNKYCRELLPEVESLAKTFGCEKENNPDCLVKEVKIAAGGVVDFSLEIDGTEKRMSSPVVAQHNAVNIAACVLVAKHLGMSMEEISLVVGQLKLPAATLQIHQYGKSIVIDDSYNANPDGFKSALKTLNSWGNDFRKVVITRGMIELGERSEELHREIGKIIAEVADELVIIASNNEKELKNEDAKRKLEVHSIFAANELLAYVKKFENEKNVILLENLIPEIVHAELIKK